MSSDASGQGANKKAMPSDHECTCSIPAHRGVDRRANQPWGCLLVVVSWAVQSSNANDAKQRMMQSRQKRISFVSLDLLMDTELHQHSQLCNCMSKLRSINRIQANKKVTSKVRHERLSTQLTPHLHTAPHVWLIISCSTMNPTAHIQKKKSMRP